MIGRSGRGLRWTVWLAALAALAGIMAFSAAQAQSTGVIEAKPSHKSAAAKAAAKSEAAAQAAANALAESTATITRITQANADLLDLLKKQQAVLEDIQYDRRLQARQISSLEERLEETLKENAEMQAKIAKLEEQITLGPSAPAPAAAAASTAPPAPAPKLVDAPPPPPSTYLPEPESAGAPGTKWWHRLFTLSGADGKSSQPFHVEGRQWRVLWHNQDRPGDAYVNTSALFINAFPKDDTIPQKVCSKLGSGGDSTELDGPGDFYLKVEASGGAWELTVEDFR